MNCAETKTLKMDDLILFGGRRQFVGNQENLAVKFCYQIFRKVLYFFNKIHDFKKRDSERYFIRFRNKRKKCSMNMGTPYMDTQLIKPASLSV